MQKEIRYFRQPLGSSFSVAHHLNVLGLDEEFKRSLTERTRVLEIGAAGGRLTEHLLNPRYTALRPENYTIFDIVYSPQPISL